MGSVLNLGDVTISKIFAAFNEAQINFLGGVLVNLDEGAISMHLANFGAVPNDFSNRIGVDVEACSLAS